MSTNDLETRIDDWIESNAEWENGSVEHTLTERNTATDGTGGTYYAIDVRFLPDHAKANLQQKFEDKLVNKVSWYRIGYHACEHDEEPTIHSVTGKVFVAEHGTFVGLEHSNIVEGSVTVRDDSAAEYAISEDFVVRFATGEIMARESGSLSDGSQYLADYDWIEYPDPCSWDDATEWAVKGVSIPAGVPTFDV